MKVKKYKNVTLARGTVKFFGISMKVFIYVSEGVLVDTGPSSLRKVLGPFLLGQKLDSVALTHHHEDHTGNASVTERMGIPAYINTLSLPLCGNKAAIPLYRKIVWGKREAFRALPLKPCLETRGGSWQAIETPGHCFDHVVFLNPLEGDLFTGDVFVTPKTRLIMETEDIPQIMDSLKKLLTLDFDTLYCGHSGVVERGREMLALKLDFLEDVRGRVLNLHQKGWGIKAINKKIFPSTPPITYISTGQWSSIHIIKTIVEHRPEDTKS